jgi:adenine-specific DNA-methyltransferase
LLRPDGRRCYDDFIARTFDGIYFLPAENRWLDMVCQNIAAMKSRFARALAYYALFQSALVKRPFNLFHRRNLYMRTARVRRGFGNKTTWDRSFEEHFRRFAAEANAAVLDSGVQCKAMNRDALAVQGSFDVVYIDPPYINGRGRGVDYHGFYHFLEGMADYANWPDRIDHGSKHRRIEPVDTPWTKPKQVKAALAQLFERFADSVLVMSYRSDGVPARAELVRLMKRFKPRVRVHTPSRRYQYVLSTNRRSTELLLIGTD